MFQPQPPAQPQFYDVYGEEGSITQSLKYTTMPRLPLLKMPEETNTLGLNNLHNETSCNVPFDMAMEERDSKSAHHQQSGPAIMAPPPPISYNPHQSSTSSHKMTAPNTMPVFGEEGRIYSPYTLPEDFVAYLFSGQQIDNSSPMQIGQQGYAKSVMSLSTSKPLLTIQSV